MPAAVLQRVDGGIGVWKVVMALGKLSEARKRGRAEGREEGREEGLVEGREVMARAMRALGRPESEIQQALDMARNRKSDN